MENTKRWSKAFLWIGRISIVVFLFIGFRTMLGFDYNSQKELYLKLVSIRNFTLIIGIAALMIGHAIKSIYTEVLDLYSKQDR